ncbi:MAG: hypothetical protein H0U42_06115 [Thermoleophilaceae bacterium]|nr:hypothetical protein [Thermoleophilaceae bacterium]
MLLAAALVLSAALLLAPAALAVTQIDEPDKSPDGYTRTASQVIAVAAETEAARKTLEAHPTAKPTAYTNGPGRWQVSYHDGGPELAQIQVDDASGQVASCSPDGSCREAWRGDQVAWTMARGYPGAFGTAVNSPFIWLPLCALFFAAFFDPRRPFRLLHVDLLVLLSFGVSHFFFNAARIDLSVPLAYPVIAYLLVRMLIAGFRPRERAGPLVPFAPYWLLVGLIVILTAFRVGLNIVDSNVIDVGYASVLGAEHIVKGEDIYGEDFSEQVPTGDTYGPFNYLVYVPFVLVFPPNGEWTTVPAAHAAAIFFDLIVIIGLFVLGRRMRAGPEGRMLGAALAFGWVAYPYTLFALSSNANDSLIAALLVLGLAGVSSTAVRAEVLALAAAAKFAPLVLFPLFVRGIEDRARPRTTLLFCAVFGLIFGALLVAFAVLQGGGIGEFYDRTIATQIDRSSPFGFWGGSYPAIEWLQPILQAGVVVLGLLVAFRPSRRTIGQVAALGAAVLLAFQLTVDHWFYLYVVWFAPFALAALFGEYRTSDAERHAVSA